MNITNSNVNEPDSSQRLISICCPSVDGPNMHVLMVRRKLEHPEETHAREEHADSTQKGPTPAGIEPRTLLMLYERTWIKLRTFLL